MKNDLKMVHEISDVHGNKMSEIDSRLNDVERYKRRWHLTLYSLSERASEDIKAQVGDICCEVLPEHTSTIQQKVDIVHREGEQSSSSFCPDPCEIGFGKRQNPAHI